MVRYLIVFGAAVALTWMGVYHVGRDNALKQRVLEAEAVATLCEAQYEDYTKIPTTVGGAIHLKGPTGRMQVLIAWR